MSASHLQQLIGLLSLILLISSSSCLTHKHSSHSNGPKLSSSSSSRRKTVNVDHFGAKANGLDDSEAFSKAWKEACGSRHSNVLLIIPKNRTYHLNPITFTGPCAKTTSLLMQMDGTIKASNRMSDYKKDRAHWIMFKDLRNFKVQGTGTFNGNGHIWWQKSCKVNESLPCEEAPTAVTFHGCHNLVVEGVRFKNSQKMHVSFQECVNVRASKLKVVAPETSPNTDGIHVTDTKNIWITRSSIKTGDDCISIVSGSKDVKATDIKCGPGHGISIGSLGKGNSEAHVSNVMINRAKLSGTTNGVRIKTWQGGKGYAKNIIFQNIEMQNVTNPIIIDQNYCDQEQPCEKQGTAVQVESVTYRNIIGTSNSENAIYFDCSEAYPCKGIVLEDINLSIQSSDESAGASCNNVQFSRKGSVSPQCSSN
ncbi:polygalacturonase-like [Impatiens glandulifera]|uniref:polygalacturonase-like n=1 Tax=Impatiens glandulifera TaxID=253017 RepID=UPI001FB07DE0|nr:polygalacturonase-like [Impatiens glandulifera]